MGSVKLFIGCVMAVRGFFTSRYHPERHYMRGPGPACARRHGGDRSARA